ncbi:hypothetical protein AAZX31_05G226100 [Glycine max]
MLVLPKKCRQLEKGALSLCMKVLLTCYLLCIGGSISFTYNRRLSKITMTATSSSSH